MIGPSWLRIKGFGAKILVYRPIHHSSIALLRDLLTLPTSNGTDKFDFPYLNPQLK